MSDPLQLARTARENLARGLGALQSDPSLPESILDLAQPIAQAMGALHQIERSQGAALNPHAEQALNHVRTALSELQTHGAGHPAADQAMEAVAGSLGSVHALHKLTQGPAAAAPAAPAVTAPAPRLTPPRPQQAAVNPMASTAQIAPQGNPLAATAPIAQPSPVAHAPQPVQHAGNHPAYQPPAPQPQGQQFQPPPQQQYQPPQAPPAAYQPPQQAPQAAPQPQYQPPQAPQQPPPAAYQPPPQQPPQPQTAPAFQAVADPFARRHSPPPDAPPGAAGAGPLRASVPVPSPPPAGNATVVEAALGAHSATNFYKGLSGNDIVDHGGLFVATYMVPKLGSTVRLKVSLPGGYEFEANALVKWAREANDGEMQPGFGARLTELSPEARQLVYRYVRNREPLFHDDF